MQVQMRNRVLGVLTHVEKKSEPTFGNTFVIGNLSSSHEQIQKSFRVGRPESARVLDVANRDDEDVHWRLRVEVSKSDGMPTSKNHVRGYRPRHDAAEDAVVKSVGHAGSTLLG